MASLNKVVVAGGNAAAVARVEMLIPARFAGLAVSNGLDVQNYVSERQPDLVLIAGGFDDVDAFEVVGKLKKNDETGYIPIIMLCDGMSAEQVAEGLDVGLDDILAAKISNEIVRARLHPLVWLSTMHSEFRRRVTSAAKVGISVDVDGVQNVDDKNCRVLFVASEFGSVATLADSLAATDVKPELEPDSFKTSARLVEETFDATVIVVAEDKPLFLCAHIRNYPRLFNLPVLIAIKSDVVRIGDAPYAQGASMVVPLTPDLEEVTAGLRFLARRQRLRWNLHGPLTATLQTGTSDNLSGLYLENIACAHLAPMLECGTRRRRNLWLALFSIQTVAGLDADSEDAQLLSSRQPIGFQDLSGSKVWRPGLERSTFARSCPVPLNLKRCKP